MMLAKLCCKVHFLLDVSYPKMMVHPVTMYIYKKLTPCVMAMSESIERNDNGSLVCEDSVWQQVDGRNIFSLEYWNTPNACFNIVDALRWALRVSNINWRGNGQGRRQPPRSGVDMRAERLKKWGSVGLPWRQKKILGAQPLECLETPLCKVG